MIRRILPVVIVTLLSGSMHDSVAQQKRALVIGINEYVPAEPTPGGSLRKWKNLDGAVPDAEAMASLLVTRFEFDEVTTLLNGSATRDSIFQSIDDLLVKKAKQGDEIVFYYAGHGSQVRNTASLENDGLDETIVPADAASGARDIRDKELREAFNRILDTGARLTLIFDSCNSGSITRGFPGGKTRFIEADDRVVSDPSDLPSPVERGALLLAAAEDDELASEMLDESGVHRGAFSWSLQQALLGKGASEPVERLFLRIRAFLRSNGMSQEPVLSGPSDRKRMALFGADMVSKKSSEVVVLGMDGNRIVLQAGLALGLRPGTELIHTRENGGSGGRFRVVEAEGLSRSYAEAIDSTALPKSGAVLTVERWMPGSTPMRLFIPTAAPGLTELTTTSDVFQTLKKESGLIWIEDPTEQQANHVIYFDGQWKILVSDGSVVTLGVSPDRESVLAALNPPGNGTSVSLFVSYPPFPEVGNSLRTRLGDSSQAAEIVEDQSLSDFILVGRRADSQFEYAWILREATSAVSASPAPPRTDWHRTAESSRATVDLLIRDSNRLDAIWGWLHLENPSDVAAFPYSFVGFEDVSSTEFLSPLDTLRLGSRYRLVLESNSKRMQDAQMNAVINDSGKQYIYVFALDRDGNGSLLYPNNSVGNGENDISLFTILPMRMMVPATGYLFSVTPPTGVDSFFVLSSAEPLPDPSILNFSGVRTRKLLSGRQTILSRLLQRVGSGSRGQVEPVPANWTIDRISIRSMDKSQ